MTFKPENITSFRCLFRASAVRIREFPGCRHVELLQDSTNPNVFFTYSQWDSKAVLEAYRNSDFFRSVWGQTRELFAEKPRAWSLIKPETEDC